MGVRRDSHRRVWLWTSRVVLPMLLVAVMAEGAMRIAERRFANYDVDLDRGDEPVIKLRGAGDTLAEGGTLYLGASDAESAFEPAVVAAAAGVPRPGYNASIGSLPLDAYGTWIDELRAAGADPDAVIVGVSPAQFLELPVDVAGEGQATVTQAQAAIRTNVEQAGQYAGRPGGIGDDLALIRSRHRLWHPTDAWNALSGGPPPADSGADRDIRPDGTNQRWDAPEEPGSPAPVEATTELLGAVVPDAVDDTVDLLGDLDDEDRAVGLVLLPITPQLGDAARRDEDFALARETVTEAACAAGVDVLDLTDVELTAEEFANLAHFSAAGRRRISEEVGRWVAGNGLAACP